MMRVYGFSPSGNCHKVRLACAQPDREFEWVEVDSSRAKTRTAAAGLPRLREGGHEALAVTEHHLTRAPWFTGTHCGVVDIALAANTAVAPDGGIALEGYPAILDWLASVAATPGCIAMPAPHAAARASFDVLS